MFEFGKPFKIKHLTIEPYRVDHSLSGATGYIIHTSSGTVVYTGDFRFHGRREKETREFMDACKEANPDLLIIEGTRIDEDTSKTEADVEDEICSISGDAKGLSVCNWSIRDTDRMLSFLMLLRRWVKNLQFRLSRLICLISFQNAMIP